MTITLLDPIGSLLSLSATYYFTKASKVAWPLSLAAILVNTYLYLERGIYGQMGLEVLYFMMTLYGWLYWQGQQKQSRPITNMPMKALWLSLPIVTIGIYGCYKLLDAYTPSSVPMLDATVTVLGLFAQLMLCRKWIENWFLWLVVDLLIVFMHWSKGIPFHSATHLFYLALAVLGYIRWHNQIHPSKTMAAQAS